MSGEVTRLGFRLEPRFFEAFRIEDAGELVGTEFPVTWGDQSARGTVVGVESDDEGVLVMVEVSAGAETGFPAALAY